MEIKEKCGECDFFISLKYDTKASGCSLDWDKTTSYNDDPCEEYKQCPFCDRPLNPFGVIVHMTILLTNMNATPAIMYFRQGFQQSLIL